VCYQTSLSWDALSLSPPIHGGTLPLLGSLDVEEKAREKDKHTSGTEGRLAANMVKKNTRKSKRKNKGVPQTTNFKNKGKTDKKYPC
jgi:hypothetical protein